MRGHPGLGWGSDQSIKLLPDCSSEHAQSGVMLAAVVRERGFFLFFLFFFFNLFIKPSSRIYMFFQMRRCDI